MWVVLEHKKLDRVFKKLPQEVLKRYEKWKDIVRETGPAGLKMIKGFHDESLRGQWNGYRSSRLGYKYRVIYKADKGKLCVFVIEINPHNY